MQFKTMITTVKTSKYTQTHKHTDTTTTITPSSNYLRINLIQTWKSTQKTFFFFNFLRQMVLILSCTQDFLAFALLAFGWIVLCDWGVACALQDIWQHPRLYPLATNKHLQSSLLPPMLWQKPKHLYTLPNVSWWAKSPTVGTPDLIWGYLN